MKRNIQFVFCFIGVLLTFSSNNIVLAQQTIVNILPEESRIKFDESELDGYDLSKLQEKLSFHKILDWISTAIKENLPQFVKMLTTLLWHVFLFSVLDHFSFSKTEKSYRFIISCLASTVLTLLLLNYFSDSCKVIEESITTIRVFCDASIPIITALLIEGGNTFLSAFFSYSISLSGAVINSLNSQLFMPLIKMFLAVGCCGCIWDDINFNPITEMIQKFIKWLIGIVFSVFTFAVSAQSFLSRSGDTIAQKFLKTAANGIPFLGSVLSDGIDGIFTLANGTKNITSLIGIGVIISVFIGPALLLLMQSIALYLTSSVAELLGQKDCVSILCTVHKAYLLMLSLLLVSVLMCIVCLLLICLGAN